jgi:hypothetical protein
MRRLVVQDFSCVDYADIGLKRMNILIGPQASGKSVISKLIYFFVDVFLSQFTSLEEFKNIDALKVDLDENFRRWFPVSAWGSKQFSICFEAGDFTIRMLRGVYRKEVNDSLRIRFSEYFSRSYTNLYEQAQKTIKEGNGASNQRSVSPARALNFIWRIQEAGEKQYAIELGDDYVDNQIFIPAGRSFFTSMGKAVAAFEHGGLLDPVTVRFGRLFTPLRERYARGLHLRRGRATTRNYSDLTTSLFGGHIRFERDDEYLETKDGRIIPFSLLSSGQQELLPLWFALEYWVWPRTTQQLVYIEEPEAHLFPTAQNLLVEHLGEIVSSKDSKSDLIITTHSPYVLAKINNLLKAGSLSGKLGKSGDAKINEVIRRESWLRPDTVAAYAIVDGNVMPIIDDDGLINAEYLDEVSGDIAREFMLLLELDSSR